MAGNQQHRNHERRSDPSSRPWSRKCEYTHRDCKLKDDETQPIRTVVPARDRAHRFVKDDLSRDEVIDVWRKQGVS